MAVAPTAVVPVDVPSVKLAPSVVVASAIERLTIVGTVPWGNAHLA